MDKETNIICPFCKTEITPNDKIRICEHCGSKHHEVCWNENAGCAVCHQTETFLQPTSVNLSYQPMNNNTYINENNYSEQSIDIAAVTNELICKKCGQRVNLENSFCPNCGAKMTPISNIKRQGHKKLILAIISGVLLLSIVIAAIFVLPNLFFSVDTLLAEGKYQEAYNKANDDEKIEILEENIIAFLCRDVIDSLKDPSSFVLRDAYFSISLNAMVMEVGAKNGYGGMTSNYWCYYYSDDENIYERAEVISDMEQETYKYYDDASDKAEKDARNASREMIELILYDGDQMSDDVILRINTLFKNDQLKNVNILDIPD